MQEPFTYNGAILMPHKNQLPNQILAEVVA
jgi:hypothetical protein